MTRVGGALFAIALLTAFGGPAQWHPRGKVLHGDVTGDGSADAVVVEQLGHRCEFRLVAGPSSARVRPEMCRQKPSELVAGPDPHVAVLVPLDRTPGLEVVVQTWRGAYMDSADIWTFRDGALRRYAGREPHLVYGASVGTGGHVVSCGSRPGIVLVSYRKYPPHGQIVRNWYRARTLRLQPIHTKTVSWNSNQAPPFPEFREPQPFPTCANARAIRTP